MLDIQIHSAPSGAIPELLQAVPVVGVNSVEYQIERKVRFSCEAQDSASFVRPNELATFNL